MVKLTAWKTAGLTVKKLAELTVAAKELRKAAYSADLSELKKAACWAACLESHLAVLKACRMAANWGPWKVAYSVDKKVVCSAGLLVEMMAERMAACLVAMRADQMVAYLAESWVEQSVS